MEKTFEIIYRQKLWNCPESASGWGSTLKNTEGIRKQLPCLVKELAAELAAKTFLDLGCGDFNWMKEIDLEVNTYFGIDIVHSIIEDNKHNYAQYNNRVFERLDFTKDRLPKADIILCRDALVHLSFYDIGKAIENIQKSESKYLLVTTYPNVEVNFEICTGGWRPLNLQKPPFNWSEPIFIEDSEEIGLPDWGKHLGLWEVKKIMLPSRGTYLYSGSVNVPGSYATVLPALSCIETYLEPRLAFREQPGRTDLNFSSGQ
ncbi:class I SAM-dependent methyltransferase [Tolypothrix campylonemoides VB511288]|nr:class I SAM-dependent methyltransferase [Tolypothrix campylonemoides VB511288]